MSNQIRIKRRASTGSAGAPSSLKNAELAYNEADNVLYYGYGDDGSGNATSIIGIAGSGNNVTITGMKKHRVLCFFIIFTTTNLIISRTYS